MNEDLTQVVDAVANKIGLAADALVPITKTLVQEVATKNEMLVWFHTGIFVGMLFLIPIGVYTMCRNAKKTNGEDAFLLYCILGGVATIVGTMGSIVNGSHALQCAAKAAAPTLTLLESVLK